MHDECKNLLNTKAWKKVPLKEVHEAGRKPIGTKTVFKTKDEADGSVRYKVRIVSMGFHMIPGKDYQESFSPTSMEITNKTVMSISLYIMNAKQRLQNQLKVNKLDRTDQSLLDGSVKGKF